MQQRYDKTILLAHRRFAQAAFFPILLHVLTLTQQQNDVGVVHVGPAHIVKIIVLLWWCANPCRIAGREIAKAPDTARRILF
jgi:hypothetical protein